MNKRRHVLFVFLLFSVLLSACHHDFSDSFAPKKRELKTQFKFSKQQNRTVEKHSGLAQKKGKFSDTYKARKHGGTNHQQGNDSYSSPKKKNKSGHRFSIFQDRVVSKGSPKSKRDHDTFSSRKRNKGSNSSGGDSYSHRAKKSQKQNRFSKSKERVVNKSTFGLKGQKTKDSYSSRKKHKGDNSSGGDSYSRHVKKDRKQNRFSNHKHRVVNKSTFSGRKNRNSDSFSGRKRNESGMFRFDKKHNHVVTKRKFLQFGTKKRERESGSFRVRHHHQSGQFAFNAKKKQVTKKRADLKGYKRIRGGSDTFSGRHKGRTGEFGYKQKKKRVGKKFLLFKPHDTDAGTFGGKTRNRNTMHQHTFSSKNKRVRHHGGVLWDLFSRTNHKNHKKKEKEMNLFDPKMSKHLNIGP